MSLNVLRILFLFRYGQANTSGDGCHWKDSLLLGVPKRMGCARPGLRVKHQESEGGRETLGKSLYCGLHRKGWARKSKQLRRFRIGEFE